MTRCLPCEQQREAFGKRRPQVAEKSFGRARIQADGSVQYPKKGAEPPPPLHGYQRDPGNEWRFVPRWPKCEHRSQVTRFKPCGAIDVVTRCMCSACPLFKAEVRLTDCDSCELR